MQNIKVRALQTGGHCKGYAGKTKVPKQQPNPYNRQYCQAFEIWDIFIGLLVAPHMVRRLQGVVITLGNQEVVRRSL